jgi:hypothetical protein
MHGMSLVFLTLSLCCISAWADELITGQVSDPQDRAVPGAIVRLSPSNVETNTDDRGYYQFDTLTGNYQLTVSLPGFEPVKVSVKLSPHEAARVNVKLSQLAGQSESVVVRDKALEPSIDLRNAEVFNRTLFTRDDQILRDFPPPSCWPALMPASSCCRNPALRF